MGPAEEGDERSSQRPQENKALQRRCLCDSNRSNHQQRAATSSIAGAQQQKHASTLSSEPLGCYHQDL